MTSLIASFLICTQLLTQFGWVQTEARPLESGQEDFDSVNVVNRDEWLAPVNVPKDLPWSTAAQKQAKSFLETEKNKLQKQIVDFRNKGAEKFIFEAMSDITEVTDYGYAKQIFRYRAIGENGKTIGFTPLAPANSYQTALGLIHYRQKSCSLLAFSLLSPKTWFTDQCEPQTPSPRNFLRASLGDYLAARPPTPLLDYWIETLNEVSKNRLVCTMNRESYLCPGLVTRNLSGNPAIPRQIEKSPNAYVSIEMDKTSLKSRVTCHAPDYIGLSKATFLSVDGYLQLKS